MPLLSNKSIHSRKRTTDVLTKEKITFDNLFLSPHVLKGLNAAGFTIPSPIQVKAIPLGKFGSDLLAQAKAGTGKTLVFTVIILENIHVDNNLPQAVVLAPTREIALQITDVVQAVGKYLKGLVVEALIGGIRLSSNRSTLGKGVHVIVGTPGRILDLLAMELIQQKNIRTFVLDEADKLLDEDFLADVLSIHAALPKRKQVIMVSATFSEKMLKIATSMMRKPQFVRLCGNSNTATATKIDDDILKSGNLPLLDAGVKDDNEEDDNVLWLRGVTQYRKVIHLPGKQKSGQTSYLFRHQEKELLSLLESVSFHQAMVFSNHRGQGERLATVLNECGWPSAFIAGDMDQKDRNSKMNNFRKFALRVLVTTDLTSRGVDVDHVNLVVNIGLPKDKETYLHRVGRTGRFGTYGVAVTIVSDRQLSDLDELCDTLDINISDLPVEIPHDTYVYELNSIEEKKAMALLAAKRNDIELNKIKTSAKVPVLVSQSSSSIKGIDTTGKSKNKEATMEARTTKSEAHEAENDIYFKWIADSTSSSTDNIDTYSSKCLKYNISLPWTSAWDDY